MKVRVIKNNYQMHKIYKQSSRNPIITESHQNVNRSVTMHIWHVSQKIQ